MSEKGVHSNAKIMGRANTAHTTKERSTIDIVVGRNFISFPESSIFNNANYMRLWGGQIFSQLGINILNFVLAVSMYNVTKSNQAVSYLVISYGLAAFLFGALAGVVVDYLSKKKTLFISALLRTFLILFLLYKTDSLLYTAVLAFLLNSVTQFFFPSESASIPILVKEKNLLAANSLYTLSFFATQIFGYMSAGIILEKVGLPNTIIFLSFLFLTSAVFIRSIKFPAEAVQNVPIKRILAKVKKEFFIGLEYIKKTPQIKESLLYIGISQVVVGLFFVLIPGYAVEVLGLKAEETSLYLVVPVAIGMVIGAVLINPLNKKMNRDKIVNVGIIGAVSGFILVSLSQRIPIESIHKVTHQFNGFQTHLPEQINRFLGIDILVFAMLFMCIIGMSNAYVIISSNTHLQNVSQDKMRGRIYGVLQTITTIAAFLPVITTGYFADKFGVNVMMFFVAVFIGFSHIVIRYKYGKPLI